MADLQHLVAAVFALAAMLVFAMMIWAGSHQS